MIIKVSTKSLKVGMYISNPGMSELSNPSVFLSEGEITTDLVLQKIANSNYADTFIDTEKGVYFAKHKKKKQEIESLFSSAENLDNLDPSDAQTFDCILESIDSADNKYTQLIDDCKKLILAAKESGNIDISSTYELVDHLINNDNKINYAMMFLSNLRGHDEHTYTHCINVALFSTMFGKYLSLGTENLIHLGFAGFYHDLGKLKISDKIIKGTKKQSAKDLLEFQKHPIYSYDMLSKQCTIPDDILRAVLEHHENYSGTGYPCKKQRNDISPQASLISIVDTFDSLKSERSYRMSVSPHKAISAIFQSKAAAFSPSLVDKFVKFIGIYPNGSIVVLKNNKKGIVMSQNIKSLLYPVVRIVLDENNRHCEPQDIDLYEAKDIDDKHHIIDVLDAKDCRLHISAYIKTKGKSFKL